MAQTAEDICNLALSRVGSTKFIDELEPPEEADQSAESVACAAVYAECRDQLLQMYAWPFAQRRAVLAEVDEEGDRDLEWAYVFALPDDCLQPQYIPTGTSRVDGREDRTPFVLEAGEVEGEDGEVDSTVLLTDAVTPTLVYTARIEGVQLYPPAFVDALAWLIASELTLSLSVQPRLLPLIEAKKDKALQRAAALAVQSEKRDVEPDSIFVRGR